MKKIKKLLTIGLAVLLMLCTSISLVGCAFNNEEPKLRKYEDFWYYYVKDAKSNRPVVSGDYIAIVDLTEEANQKDRIIIPETIEGKPVVSVGMSGFMALYDIGAGANYTKLYLPKTLQNIIVKAREYFAKMFLIEEPNEMFRSSKKFFTTNEIYEKYNGKEDSFKVEIANIQYVLEDEIYFIDDYRESEGSLILEPPVPQKDGYIFEGWYLEKEYINKWDFDNDLHIYDESQKVTFLYAKWISACDTPANSSCQHTYEWVGSEGGHQKVYTCGCPSPDIAELHRDNDGDDKCDVCGWSMAEMLPEDAVLLIQAYEEKYPNAGKATILRYCGRYESGAIVAMLAGSDESFDCALWTETVADYDFNYSDGNRIRVLYDNEFYTLTEAYENGYLTKENIADILENTDEWKALSDYPYLYD